MSIRLDNDQLAGAAAQQTGHTDQIRSTGNRSSLTSRSRGASGDSVEISSMAEGIADASAAQSTSSAQRVRQLTAIYASGRYQVDSRQLSQAMVSNAITSSSGGIE
jgi:anti-sigma28 factor (negative regulator of flagellin synthesis)